MRFQRVRNKEIVLKCSSPKNQKIENRISTLEFKRSPSKFPLIRMSNAVAKGIAVSDKGLLCPYKAKIRDRSRMRGKKKKAAASLRVIITFTLMCCEEFR